MIKIKILKKSILIFSILFASISESVAQDWNPNIYNIEWDSQSKNATESMPVGGGDIGMNVWVENNELLIYMQRSGVMDEYNGFPKLGRLRLWSNPNIFDGATDFSQKLDLASSSITIKAKHKEYGDLEFKVWSDVKRPRIHIECNSSNKIEILSQFESWRTDLRYLPNEDVNKIRWGWWDTGMWDNEVALEPDNFKPEEDKFSFYHINPDEKLTSKLAYRLMGFEDVYGKFYDPLKDLVWGGQMEGDNIAFDKKVTGKYVSTDYTGWRYKSIKPQKSQDIVLWFHNSHCKTAEKWFNEIEDIKAKNSISKSDAWKENAKWWSKFWDNGYIILNPEKNEADSVWRIGRNYNLFRYMTALNAYGENPTMFNGGLLTVDPGAYSNKYDFHPDWRAWSGGNYTMQNQRWLYWPMLKWGDFEHMESQFDFLERTFEVGQHRVKDNYGFDGWMYDETGTVYGLPMPMHYGFDKSLSEQRTRPSWIDRGLSANWCIIHHHTAMLEFSYMILEYYRYSGRDISRWLPIVNGTIEFYDNYYRHKAKYNANWKEYDENGKLIIFPAGACESHYYVCNPVPDIAGLQAVVEGAMSLPQEYKDKYFNGGDKLPKIFETIPDFHTEKIGDDIVMPPGKSVVYSWWKKTELYINYPMFPFNRIDMNDPRMESVYNTYKHWEKWQTMDSWKVVTSWSNGNVAFARMGLVDEAKDLNFRKLDSGNFRFPAFWGGPGGDWTPDHNWGGTGAVGLQEMLMQSLDDKIVITPTWPDDWNCEFKLHAPKNTTITGKVIGGEVRDLVVYPAERAKDIVIKAN
ncbi:MAG: DUF5703 domain-containing protein [Rikenellaceae bacterium]